MTSFYRTIDVNWYGVIVSLSGWYIRAEDGCEADFEVMKAEIGLHDVTDAFDATSVQGEYIPGLGHVEYTLLNVLVRENWDDILRQLVED